MKAVMRGQRIGIIGRVAVVASMGMTVPTLLIGCAGDEKLLDSDLFSTGRTSIEVVEGERSFSFSSDPGGSRRVLSTYERTLSLGEIVDLIEPVVNTGFMESSREHIHEQMKAARGQALPRGSDSPDMVTTINLERYSGPGETVFSPAANRIGLHSPDVYARHYLDISEIQSLATLQMVLHDYFKAAKQEAENR